MGNISFIRIVSKATRGSRHRCGHTRWEHLGNVRIWSLCSGQSGGPADIAMTERRHPAQNVLVLPSTVGNERSSLPRRSQSRQLFNRIFFCKVAATKWFPSMEPFPGLHVLRWLSEIKRCDMKHGATITMKYDASALHSACQKLPRT